MSFSFLFLYHEESYENKKENENKEIKYTNGTLNFTGFGSSILFWYVEVIEYAMASETDGTFEEIEQINEGVEETLVGKEPGAK